MNLRRASVVTLKAVEVYLLPARAGDYFLYSGEHDGAPPADVADSESTAQKLLALARKSYDTLTWRRRQKELLLKSLGALDYVRILYPASLPEARARRIYDDFIQKETAKHKKWMIVNTAALPVAVPLSLIPGPNLLLAYLAWRSVSHYQTKKASEKAAELEIDFVPDGLLDELVDVVSQWPFRAKHRIRKLGHDLGLARLDRAYG